jgi:hypothetical protein
MKIVKFISIFVLLIGFTFALVQCAKEEDSKQDNSQKIALRSYSGANMTASSKLDCGSLGNGNLNCYTLADYSVPVNIDPNEVQIPPEVIGDCKVTSIYDITICLNPSNYKILSFEFDDFRVVIPENGECNTLQIWLDNLENSDPSKYDDAWNDLSNYVAKKGKENFMENLITNNPELLEFPLEVSTYLSKCYIKSVISQLIPIYDLSESSDPSDWDIIGYERHDVVVFLPCGVGCCIARTLYYIDKNGQIHSETESYSVGQCEDKGFRPLSNSNLRGGGDGQGNGCYQRCN